MSRTFRKHSQSFEEYYKIWLSDKPRYNYGYVITGDWTKEFLRKERYKYKTKTSPFYDWHGIPKEYRKSANRKRRNHDIRELYKAVNWEDYPAQCSWWNCKDNDHWSYY